jgi:hypothetical protein
MAYWAFSPKVYLIDIQISFDNLQSLMAFAGPYLSFWHFWNFWNFVALFGLFATFLQNLMTLKNIII